MRLNALCQCAIAAVAVALCSCADKPGSWEVVAASIPGDIDGVAAISTNVLPDDYKGGQGAVDNDSKSEAGVFLLPQEARRLMAPSLDHFVFVCHKSMKFYTWPVLDPESAQSAVSGWDDFNLDSSDRAFAGRCGNGVVITDMRQAWFVPGASDPEKAVSEINSIVSRAADSEDSDRAGLNGIPSASAVVVGKPLGVADFWYCFDDEDSDGVVTGKVDTDGGKAMLTIQRHGASGAVIPLYSALCPAEKALADAVADAPVALVTGFKRGGLASLLAKYVTPFLSLTQRLAFSAVGSALADADGTVAMALRSEGGGVQLSLLVSFANGGARMACSKIMGLAQGRVDGLVCEVLNGDILLSLKFRYEDAALASALAAEPQCRINCTSSTWLAAVANVTNLNRYFDKIPVKEACVSIESTQNQTVVTLSSPNVTDMRQLVCEYISILSK